jgi:small GTP-binding protein
MDDYLNNLNEVDAEYKVVLAGNTDIGKTTFFKKLTKGTFNEEQVSTIGIDQKSFNYDITITENGQDVKKKVKIILYDTAGQERYASITKTYFKKASGIILLYSIIDRDSFINLTKWLKDVRDKLGNYENNKYLVFLMGTKFDIVKNDESKRKVKEEEALDFCDQNDLLWYGEYSSKDTSQETFQKLLAEFAKKLYIKVGFNKLQRDSVSTLSSKKTKKQKKRCGCKK